MWRAPRAAVPSMVVAVAALAWFVTGQALRPVLSITRRANEITGSTLHQRVPEPRTDDEIGELAPHDERDARPDRGLLRAPEAIHVGRQP
ncbi:MAG: HAMP domain-containing protein [Actinobacteria bacterium]|nr:HAMP domain-containing protein [Actinomycetota bacterium]